MTDTIFKSAAYIIIAYILCLIAQYYIPSAQWVGLILLLMAFIYIGMMWHEAICKIGTIRSKKREISKNLIIYTSILLFLGIGLSTITVWGQALPLRFALQLLTIYSKITANSLDLNLFGNRLSLDLGVYTLYYGYMVLTGLIYIATLAMWICHLKGIELAGSASNFCINYPSNPNTSQINKVTYATQYTTGGSNANANASQMPTIYDWQGQGSYDWSAVQRWSSSMKLAPDTLPLRGICSDGISLISKDVPFSQLEAQGSFDIGSAASNPWCIPDSSVSSVHASLRMRNGEVYLKAISDRGVTKVANQVVQPGQAVGISRSALIEIGGVKIRVF